MTTRREFMEAGAGAFLLCLQKFSILSMVPPDIEDTSSSSWPSTGTSSVSPCPHCGKQTGVHGDMSGPMLCMNCDQPRATFAGLNTESEVAEAAMRDFNAGRWEHARDILDQINKTR